VAVAVAVRATVVAVRPPSVVAIRMPVAAVRQMSAAVAHWRRQPRCGPPGRWGFVVGPGCVSPLPVGHSSTKRRAAVACRIPKLFGKRCRRIPSPCYRQFIIHRPPPRWKRPLVVELREFCHTQQAHDPPRYQPHG
jgi:hypothetical protein